MFGPRPLVVHSTLGTNNSQNSPQVRGLRLFSLVRHPLSADLRHTALAPQSSPQVRGLTTFPNLTNNGEDRTSEQTSPPTNRPRAEDKQRWDCSNCRPTNQTARSPSTQLHTGWPKENPLRRPRHEGESTPTVAPGVQQGGTASLLLRRPRPDEPSTHCRPCDPTRWPGEPPAPPAAAR